MAGRIRRLLVYLLLGCLPLQGLAAASKRPCSIGADAVAGAAQAETPCHQAAGDEQPAQDSGGEESARMDCCNAAGLLVAVAMSSDPARNGGAFEPGRPDRFQSYFPERLQRPPLAAA